MKRDAKKIIIPGVVGEVCIKRGAHGFPHIAARDELDRYYGLGYAHGRDRQMHMGLLKLIGQGQASAQLKASEPLIASDKYMRWLDLAGDAAEEARHVSAEVKAVLDAYCKGVNDAVRAAGRPFEFALMGYRPDDWTPADVLLMVKLIGFAGLSQSQGDLEKLIVQMIRQGVEPERLKDLFPTIREAIPDSFIDLLKNVHLTHPIIPATAVWREVLPNFSSSNNWAVRPQKTASGQAILCGDPHLALQLPSVWYPAVLAGEGDYLMGATLPGMPFVAMGRTRRLAWAVTYGTADVCDYFVEEVKAGKYRSGDQWMPLRVREEIIRPKNQAAITLRVCETERGLIEGEVQADGYYLCYAWTGKQVKGTAAESLNRMLQIVKAQDAAEARDAFAGLTFAPFNWVFADAAGNIGYQLGGLVPNQPAGTSGLLPYLGWEKEQNWDGMVDPKCYPRAFNPACGFLVTANNDLNHFGRVAPMKLPISSYRADRIHALLREKDDLTVADMKRIQNDRYARQAKAFMEVIRPLLPESKNGDILRNWDLRYDADSLGATLFERVYRELVLLVFGDCGLGREVIAHLLNETMLFNILHGYFDRILLREASASRHAMQTALERGLREKAIPHGDTRKIYVEHLFFRGKLPRFLGFDRALANIGSWSTVSQASVCNAGALAATFRMICDFAEDVLHTTVAGGASDRRFSKYYASGLEAWKRGEYEVLDPFEI